MISPAQLTRAHSSPDLDSAHSSFGKDSVKATPNGSPENSSSTVVSLGAMSTETASSSDLAQTVVPAMADASTQTDDMRKPNAVVTVLDIINGAEYGEAEFDQDMENFLHTHGRAPTLAEISKVTVAEVMSDPAQADQKAAEADEAAQQPAKNVTVRQLLAGGKFNFDAAIQNFVKAQGRTPKLAELKGSAIGLLSTPVPPMKPATASASNPSRATSTVF